MLYKVKKSIFFECSLKNVDKLTHLPDDIDILILDYSDIFEDTTSLECLIKNYLDLDLDNKVKYENNDLLKNIIVTYFCNFPISLTKIFINPCIMDVYDEFKNLFLEHAKIPYGCKVSFDIVKLDHVKNKNIFVYYEDNNNNDMVCYVGHNHNLYIFG